MTFTNKLEFLGPVTLLTFSLDESLLYVGVGSTIFLYAIATGKLLNEHIVLTRGILHGCDIMRRPDVATNCFAGVFFGQKHVSCFYDLPQTPEAAQKTEKLMTLGKPKVFCDWVFDAHLLMEDVASRTKENNLLVAVGLAHNFVQIWDPASNSMLRTVQCAERCILYALAFHGRSLDELVVASGTVFQQILLWNPMGNAFKNAKVTVEPAQRLHAHDGVLFKLAWSSDARSLASVSDDRTVQLWSNNGNLKESQLHLPRTRTRDELFQCGYSPVFRAWGHSARIWDVSFWERGVVTASEDGLSKLWDLNGNCLATLQGHMGRNVWRVAVLPLQNIIATGGGDGAVKLWDVTRQLMSSSDRPGSSDSCKTICIPVTTTSAALEKEKKIGTSSHSVRNIVLSTLDCGKTAFVASEHGEIFHLDLLGLTAEHVSIISPTDGNLVKDRTGGLSTFAIDSSGRFLLLGEVSGRVCLVNASTGILLYSWTTQTNVRVMKVWWDQEDAIFVSSANGVLTEWRSTVRGACDSLTPLSIAIHLVATFQILAKSSISSILVVDRSPKVKNIVGGDGHGNLYIFHRSSALEGGGCEVDMVRPPDYVLKGVHGRELVATLLLGDVQDCHIAMLSGGHDGYICSYALKEDTSGALTATQLGRKSIRGISTVKQLQWRQQASFDGKTKNDLMVFGFHASYAVLYNMSAQYRVFKVECGGWRRPHALCIGSNGAMPAIPSHTFVFTPPTQKQYVEIKVHSTSEDNSLMLHRRRTQCDQGKSKILRWGSVASGVAHTTTVRALATFRRINSDGVEEYTVLSGGGKQRLNVWRLSGEYDVLRHVCGQERAEAAQDHRILGLATLTIPYVSDTYRLVTACNSEGSTQLLLLDVDNGRLFELGECRSASRKPILSCIGFQEGDAEAMVAGLALGSTDGLVTLWDLSLLLKEIGSFVQSYDDLGLLKEKLLRLISDLQPCGSYLAHDMGTNCIDLVSCVKSTEGGSLDVTIVSGGDDQNLNLHELRFPSCQTLFKSWTVNASGSAIKTLACVNSQHIFVAGYDQRVSKWSIQRNENGYMLEWQGAIFSECADIADLAIRESLDGTADEIVVVGQGLQMMRFQRSISTNITPPSEGASVQQE
ncbi:unnamed protein product [Peronospora belbahrii]|uniref:Anaphase-promoting complex subunit 4 WD40 domain-containing protein n=1 Tax=Peronospora belbahrii TaxID=622444 RepID=A0AAU9KW43_9STRA|nr:unnamed protein product [Peronospora belbahrii]